MSDTQKLIVTRQTIIELQTDGPSEPIVQLKDLGKSMIEGTAVAEIEASRAGEDEELEPPTGELKTVQDVDDFATATASGAVEEGLRFLEEPGVPWNAPAFNEDRIAEDLYR